MPGMSAPVQAPPKPVPPPGITPRPVTPAIHKPAGSESMEWKLGTNWLPKIAIVLVVLGLAYGAQLFWGAIPKSAQILILYLIGPALLAGGVVLEKKENFKVLGRVLIGGGWAWTFGMTLSIYWLDAVKIKPVADNPIVELILLLLVATGMVWHTLRYDSQVVTAFAFFLAFGSIAVTPETGIFAPVAGVILIGGITPIVLRRWWFELEIFGILSSYLGHFWWLYQLFLKVPDHSKGFPDSTASLALSGCYWAIFRFSYLARKVMFQDQERVSTTAGLLSPLLFLALLKYQSLHPEWAFYALLAIGAVEFTLGQLPVARARKMPFYLLSSLGASLMVAAVPFKHAGPHFIDILWLAGAEAFLMAGIFGKERLFRQFAGIISFLVAGHLIVVHLPAISEKLGSAAGFHDSQLSTVLAVVAAVFYTNCHIVARRWAALFDRESEFQAIGALSFLASVFAVGAIYSFFPAKGVAIALGALIALLSWAGWRFKVPHTVYQSHWIAVVAFADVCANGLDIRKTLWHGFPQIILTFGSVAALFYLSSSFVRLSKTAQCQTISVIYKWAATTLITVLIWYWAPDWLIAVYWTALALVMALIGQWLKQNEFRWQALALGLLASAYALGVNLWLTGPKYQLSKGLSCRLVSMTVIAGFVYLLTRWAPMEELKPAYSWAGTVVLGALAWKESPQQWTAVLWVALAVCLAVAARFWKEKALLWQCHALSAVALIWMITVNFRPEYGPEHGRQQLIAVLAAAALYYALTWITNVTAIIGDEWIAQTYSWAGSMLLGFLVWYQRQAPHVHERALYWAVIGLLLFEIGYKWKPAFLRMQGYVALVSSFIYIFFANFNNIQPQDITDPNLLTVLPLAPFYFWTYYRLRIREVAP